MKSKRTTLLFLTLMSLLFAQCKSVDFTVLGFFNKQYVVDYPKSDSLHIVNQGVSITGLITDEVGLPQVFLNVYFAKRQTIKYQTVTNEKGVFSLQMHSPDTLDIYVIKTPDDNYKLALENVIIFRDTILRDIIF